MADVTPPVALAAFAASAISRADPIKTGFQAFFYEIRTALLPVVFIFNHELLLIGVTSFWHGLSVFVVSLIAMLCFSSLTQNYMLVRNKWYEGVILAVVVIGLFRPTVYMDYFHPEFEHLDVGKFVAGEVTGKPGYDVRFRAVHETEYGPQYRLYRMVTPEFGAASEEYGLYGMKIAKDGDDYVVEEVMPGGLAEQAGVEQWDYVTEVHVEQEGRPQKALVYPFMLALLGIVFLLQYMRFRRQRATAAPVAGS